MSYWGSLYCLILITASRSIASRFDVIGYLKRTIAGDFIDELIVILSLLLRVLFLLVLQILIALRLLRIERIHPKK